MSGDVQKISPAVVELYSKLEAADQGLIREAVVRMLAAFPGRVASDPKHADMMTRTYVAALSGEPLWAITAAAKSFLRGKVAGHNLAFPPSAPQWACEARKESDKVRDEIAVRVADAKASEERRAAIETLQARKRDSEERARFVEKLLGSASRAMAKKSAE